MTVTSRLAEIHRVFGTGLSIGQVQAGAAGGPRVWCVCWTCAKAVRLWEVVAVDMRDSHEHFHDGHAVELLPAGDTP